LVLGSERPASESRTVDADVGDVSYIALNVRAVLPIERQLESIDEWFSA
jgi:hypothetical protein